MARVETVRQADGRRNAGVADGDGIQHRAAGAADRAAAVGGGEQCIDPSEMPDHLSGSGPATCVQSAAKSMRLRPVLRRRNGRSGVEKPIAGGPFASSGH